MCMVSLLKMNLKKYKDLYHVNQIAIKTFYDISLSVYSVFHLILMQPVYCLKFFYNVLRNIRGHVNIYKV